MLREALEGSAAMSVELPVRRKSSLACSRCRDPLFARIDQHGKDGLVRVDGRVVWLEDIQGWRAVFEDCGLKSENERV